MTAAQVLDAQPRADAAVWWARITRRSTDPVEHSLVAVHSARFPNGTPVDLCALDARGRRPAGWLVDVRYRTADGGVVRIDVSGAVADPQVPLWFVEAHHVGPAATGSIPAMSLSAFSGDAFPAGSLIGPHQLAAARVRPADRIADVRWFTRSGLVDAVTVPPRWRGRGLGRLLVVAAEGLVTLRGRPHLTGDGRLTDSAAAWLDAAPAYWRPRLARRTHHLPETGPGAPIGVQRLLADLPTRLI